MHYLKSPYPHSLLPFTQSHKRPKVTGTMETRKTSIPLSYTSNPIKPRHTHARVKKRTQLPLSYHRCQQTEHTGRVTNTQTRTPSCSALSPSLNSFQCILPLACHSSPQYYQSLSPRPHNGSSCSCCICGSRYFKVLAGWIKRGMWKMNSHSQEGHMSWMHNKLREWQGEKKAEEGNGKERGKKKSFTSCLKHCRHLHGNNITHPNGNKMHLWLLLCAYNQRHFSGPVFHTAECGADGFLCQILSANSLHIPTIAAGFALVEWFHHHYCYMPLKFVGFFFFFFLEGSWGVGSKWPGWWSTAVRLQNAVAVSCTLLCAWSCGSSALPPVTQGNWPPLKHPLTPPLLLLLCRLEGN